MPAWVRASSERRNASRESSPSATSVLSPASRASADWTSSCLTAILPSSSASEVLSVRRCSACSFSFTRRLLCSLSSASTDSLVSSSTTASPRSTRAPGSFRIRSTRASTGLDRTRSISGTTVPEAMIIASTGPVVTRAVRMRARDTPGRSRSGSHARSSTTARTGTTVTMTRTPTRRRRSEEAISRSTPVA